MSKLVEVLYPLPDYRRTPLTLLRWWESRRPVYNAVVGSVGTFSLGGTVLFAALPPHPELMPPPVLLIGVLAYGIVANLCYSMGWGLEVLARLLWGADAPDLGPTLFRQGLIFSVGLTLLPLGLAGLFWMMRIAFAILT